MAMLFYVHRLYRYAHDSFDYSKTNQYLTLQMKVFLKKLVCFPTRISRCDFARLTAPEHGCVLSFPDVVHMTMICFQAQRVAKLIWVTRALNDMNAKA
mmetsp:Transcript_43063/g.98190  ORF Transcript_43063/g.98190 Transcript_43063/m.98190 type:complete len:98 (-) Transcript_43063:42-335(-)